MQINFSNFIPKGNYYKTTNDKNNFIQHHSAPLNNLQNDVFVKSDKISFKSSYSNEKLTIKDILVGGGIIGGAFLTPLLIGISIAKHQHPEDIFTYDGQYICSVDKLYVNEQKAKELGVDLSPERFKGANCFADPINGIYKNEDKGVDIDLKAGKYIDAENGIFVEPESKTSVIFTGGDAIPIILLDKNPSFSGSSNIYGGGTGIIYGKGDRDKFIDIANGKAPEDFEKDVPWTFDSPNEVTLKNGLDSEVRTAMLATLGLPNAGFNPSDRRDFSEKIHDAIFGNNDISPYMHDYWGRDIVRVDDSMGKPHYVALSEELAQRVQDEHISYETVQKFMAHAAEHPIQNWAKENHWDNLNLLNPSVSEFLDNINEHHLSDKNNDSSEYANDGINDANDYSITQENDFEDDISGLV